MATYSKRQKKDGTVSYRAAVRIKGYPETSATFSSEVEAQEWARLTEAAYKTRSVQHLPTLNDAIERYLVEFLPQKKSEQITHEKNHLRFWKEHLGNKILSEIVPFQIDDISMLIFKKINARTNKPLSEETRRKHLMTLSFLFNICIKEWRWVSSNPVSPISKKTNAPKKEKQNINLTDPLCVEFYDKINRFRHENNIKISHIAKKAEMSPSTIQHILNKNNNITFQSMIRICRAIGLEWEFKWK